MPFSFSLFLCIASMKKSVPLCRLCLGALLVRFCICALFVTYLQAFDALIVKNIRRRK